MGTAKIVNVGVDTLVLNAFYLDERGRPFKCELDPSLRIQLDEWKRAAQEVHFWGIEDAYALPDRLAVLWAYATGQADGGPDGVPDGWLRCVASNGDKNRSRWPTHPVWQLIQAAFLDPMEVPPQFGKIVRKRWEEHSIEKGIEAVMGYLTSLAAWAGSELAEDGVDFSVVLHWLAKSGGDYLERVKRDFSVEVQRKRMDDFDRHFRRMDED